MRANGGTGRTDSPAATLSNRGDKYFFQIQGGGMGVPWAAFCKTPRSRHQIEIHPPFAFIHPAQNNGVTAPFDCDYVF